MSVLSKALVANSGKPPVYSDDVFSTYLYTGNGSTQTINNDIDLAGKGGMVWLKLRDTTTGNHNLVDTARGVNSFLYTSTIGAAVNDPGTFSSFNSNGFSMNNSYGELNSSGRSFVSWTFRRAPKFFDCGTYTGNAGTLSISHTLGVKPGFLVIKKTSSTGDWLVLARKSDGNIYAMYLNTTAAQFYDGAEPFGDLWSTTSIKIDRINGSIAAGFNDSGASYVWYAFAHDTSAEGIIQCGSFTTDASGNATVTLGWEPQYLMRKRTSGTGNWELMDVMRGWTNPDTSGDARLAANDSSAETSSNALGYPMATGFYVQEGFGSSTYIYLAIRRPNKPPTSGTQVYNAIARTGTGAAATVTGVGFAPDLALIKQRNTGNFSTAWDRLRGATKLLRPTGTSAEETFTDALTGFDSNDGVKLGADSTALYINASGGTFINHFFRRAPGVFDVVAYTGTGSSLTFQHSLKTTPQLVIIKKRSSGGNPRSWAVWTAFTTNHLALDTISPAGNQFVSADFGTPSSTTFTVNPIEAINQSGYNYIAYLFSTTTGISKVGTYTGNNTSQTIGCGFSTGARFILIKRTDATGDWYVWDTTRGIVAGNDPHLSLNSTAAEVTTNDSIDPDSTGFIVNQVAATNINVTSATYIYLAFA